MTRRRFRRTAPIVSLLAGLGVVFACSGRTGEFANSAVPPVGTDDSGSPSSCSTVRCSRDLKKVISGCDDTILTTCGPDEGCGDRKCVDACTAAAMSKGSIGCDFFVLPPDDLRQGSGSCFVAMIANTWDRPVTVTGMYGGDPLDLRASTYTVEGNGARYAHVDGSVAPGQVALIFLSQSPINTSVEFFTTCPKGVTPALLAEPITHGTTITKAFRLTTDAPVSAYSIYPYGGAQSFIPTATLLLPVSSWGNNYLAISSLHSAPGNPSIQIIASEDDTEVRIKPKVDIGGGTLVAGATAGDPAAYTLARGQVLQITQREDLTGSPIESTKPVGLYGGSECTYIPGGVSACDTNQQQLPPISQWGSEYALVPYRPRADGPMEVLPWQLVGAADGTVLSYDPDRPSGAPSTLFAGQAVTFMTDRPVIVKSQDVEHPLYAGAYMTGCDGYGGPQRLGDPEFLNVVPSDQFLDRYVFFADYTYPETRLTFIRRRTANGFSPVTLACAGEITGFQPLGTTGEYEFAWVDLTRGSTPQKFDARECGYGRHEAESEGPFSVTLWGFGEAASYAYPGGTGSRPLTNVIIPVR